MNQQQDNGTGYADADLFQTLQPCIDATHIAFKAIIKVFEFLFDSFIPHSANVDVAVDFGFYFSNVSHDYKLPVLVDGNARWLPGHMIRTAPPAPGAADEPEHKYE